MSRQTWLLSALGLALLLIPPVFGNGYQIYLGTIALIWLVLVVGLQLIFGYGGLLSVAHGGLFGVGAYVSAVLNVDHGWPMLLSGLAGVAASVLVSVAIGAVSTRADGMAFAVLTLAFGAILYELFLNLTDVTGGPLGVVGLDPLPEWGDALDLPISTSIQAYVVVAVAALGSLGALSWVVHSEFGRALICTREDDTLASSAGIDVRQARRWAFSVSGAFAGLAGVLFAHYFQFIAPESFTFLAAFQAVVMVVAGGSGLILGTVVGAVGLSLLPELLRDASQYQTVTYGVLLFLAIRFLPSGVVGAIADLKARRPLKVGQP